MPLYTPISSMPQIGGVVNPPSGGTAGGLTFPVQGYTGDIALHWGSVPGGSDIMAPRGTPVVAMNGGKVLQAGWNSVGGNSVLIQGNDGNQYYYAHLASSPAVAPGQTIPSGTYLGPVGNTGDAQGGPTHLHIGIGPTIMLGADKFGGTGGNFNAVGLLKQALSGSPIPNAPAGYNPNITPIANGQTNVQTTDYGSPLKNRAAQIAQNKNIDPNIFVRLIGKESNFDPRATSPKGAQGLSQLMPGTARGLGVNNPYDPEESLMGGATYFAQLLARFGGDYTKALAAYNAGPGAVEQYGGIPPYAETQGYVADILNGQNIPNANIGAGPIGSNNTPNRPQGGLFNSGSLFANIGNGLVPPPATGGLYGGGPIFTNPYFLGG